MSMMKSLEVILLPADEAAFTVALRDRVPSIQFVDDCYWPTPDPPRAPSIQACGSKFVYLWNPAISPTLPSVPSPAGLRYHGPQSGIVVQLIRSVLQGPNLRAGTISVGWDDALMTPFVNAVWRALRVIAPQPPACVNPVTGEVLLRRAPGLRVGLHAAEWCLAASDRFFRDGTINNYYRVLPACSAG